MYYSLQILNPYFGNSFRPWLHEDVHAVYSLIFSGFAEIVTFLFLLLICNSLFLLEFLLPLYVFIFVIDAQLPQSKTRPAPYFLCTDFVLLYVVLFSFGRAGLHRPLSPFSPQYFLTFIGQIFFFPSSSQ